MEPKAETLPAAPAAAALFAHWPGCAALVDADGRILWGNSVLTRVAGHAPTAGHSLPEMFVPESRAAVLDAVRDAFHPGIAHTVEAQLAAGGRPEWAQLTVTPVQDGGQRLAAVACIDVTARHEEEERLRHSERLMVDSEGITHLGVWYWDITQPHASWSEELFRIYGLDPKAHVPTYQDYLTRVHPDDVERVKAATEAVFQRQVPYSHDERIRHADGHWVHLHTWARPVVDEHGRLKALMGVCQDVTDRKVAEQARDATEARFRALFESSAVGIALLDEGGAVIEANAAFAALVDEGTLAAGTRLAAFLDGDSAAELERQLGQLRNAQPPARRLDVAVRHAGGMKPARLEVVRAQAPGQPPFLIATLADAALSAQAAEADTVAFARLLEIKRLEAMGERRERLLRVASHELKNPLTPVLFQLYLLREGKHGPLNPRQARSVAIASGQAERIKQLLQDVLDMARIEHGRLAMRRERADLAAIARKVADAYRDVAKGWEVALECDAPAPVPVSGDPDRLEQVLANLVGNALKFTPAGGTVRVRAAQAGREATVAVEDTGPGMDAAQQALLFEAFSQVHAPGSAREPGTGLGLYISRSIMEAHGGRIAVDSAPGKGATFTVSLPLWDDVSAHAGAAAAPAEAAA